MEKQVESHGVTYAVIGGVVVVVLAALALLMFFRDGNLNVF